MMGLLSEGSPSGRKTHHCYFVSAAFVFLASLTCLEWAETKVIYYGSDVEEYQMKETVLVAFLYKRHITLIKHSLKRSCCVKLFVKKAAAHANVFKISRWPLSVMYSKVRLCFVGG